MRPCVVMVGNLSEGYVAFGPFASFDEATAWCDANGHAGDSWVLTLKKPA